ncbi:MAG: thioredoxin fold domain-containing protein [Candidatus Sedimenticola endophacoides]
MTCRAAWALLLLLPLLCTPAHAGDDPFVFDDSPLQEPLEHPPWFKQSFLDLNDDLAEARATGKRGIILYYGQSRCPYCQKLMEVNFTQEDIASYTREHFDIIPIDIWGIAEVTDLSGNTLIERELAEREQTRFIPSLVFYDLHAREALRLRGYHPPYTFRAALEYVADGHHEREPFKTYLERAEGSMAFLPGELNEEPLFDPPPHALDRSRLSGERPLAVFFERGECHACDILHTGPLQEATIQQLLSQFENVQLDMHAEQPVITPGGERTTARRWAEQLGIFYSPSILFFDEQGREILRVDSVIQFYRLRNILDYIVSKGYLSEPNYQRWRAR